MGTNEEDAVEFLQTTLAPPAKSKPNIDGLQDALDSEGKPVFAVGDMIVIESYMNFGSKRKYLHTRVYRVKALDEVTGDVQLYDENYKQSANTNIHRLGKTGDVIKMHAKYIKIDDE
jgi:hypothetical protein